VPNRGVGNYSLASGCDHKISIPTIRLDRFAEQRNINLVDFMKMDIKGSETKALRGATNLQVNEMVVESNPYWLKRMGSSGEELLDVIASRGVDLQMLNRWARCIPIDERRSLELCVEEESYFNLVLRSNLASDRFRSGVGMVRPKQLVFSHLLR
jgi:hypothetical protein